MIKATPFEWVEPSLIPPRTKEQRNKAICRWECATVPASKAVVWVNYETKDVVIRLHGDGWANRQNWADPIGANYAEWREMGDKMRVQLMLETAIDLVMQGFQLNDILIAFSQVEEFIALADKSLPMEHAFIAAGIEL